MTTLIINTATINELLQTSDSTVSAYDLKRAWGQFLARKIEKDENIRINNIEYRSGQYDRIVSDTLTEETEERINEWVKELDDWFFEVWTGLETV